MASVVAKWIGRLPAGQFMTLHSLHRLRARYQTINHIYKDVVDSVRQSLQSSDYLRCRGVLAIWERLLELMTSSGGVIIRLPEGVTLVDIRA